MNNKIIALIVCAVVVIGGCAAAVAVLKKPAAKVEEPTTVVSSTTETTQTVTETQVSEVTEEITDEQGSVIGTQAATDSQGNIITTIKSAVNTTVRVAGNTTARGTAARGTTARGTTARGTTARGTTRSSATTGSARTTVNPTAGGTTKPQAVSNGSGGGIIENLIGDNADQSLVGYRYSSDGYYYCDDKDNWQKYTGYNEVYDKWAGVAGMFIDQVRVRFEYENKGWMVQLWKGQYGFVLIGAEIGLYTCDLADYNPDSNDFHHFNAADSSDWLNMSLTMYYRPKGDSGAFKPMFTRPYAKYWWCTGFVKGQLAKYSAPRTELKTLNRITFKTTEMANIYVNQLQKLGFGRAASSSALSDDTYAQNGSDVYVLWATKYNGSFDGSSS